MKSEILQKYLQETDEPNIDMVSYVANLEHVAEVDPEIAGSIVLELKNQRNRIKLIASENYSSLSCQMAMGNLLTDKYSEGFPYHRYYAGCENVDAIESKAVELAKELFGAEHAYVQPHCGADANMIAYWAILDAKVLIPKFKELQNGYKSSIDKQIPKTYSDLSETDWQYIRTYCHNQKLLAMDYGSGSHLTHGYRQNISAQIFDCYYYSVNENGLLDYSEIEKKAMEIRPLVLLAGYSAYPRAINFRYMRRIADECGAVLMVDMAHFAGLVAGKQFTGDYDPVRWADIVTTTTHKTLRGPRGGLILCKEWLKESVNKGCPLVMGGPLPHIIAAKAIALKEASAPEFVDYARRIIENAKDLADALKSEGCELYTNGTENHMVMLKTESFGLTGKQAENALLQCGVVLNRNALPDDPNGAWYTSGLRIGVPAVTTLGMGKQEMQMIAHIIASVLKATSPVEVRGTFSKSAFETNKNVLENASKDVLELMERFKVYPTLDLEFLEKNFCSIK